MATGVNTATVALDECLQAGTMVVSTPMAHLVPKVAPAIPQFAPALVPQFIPQFARGSV